MDVTPEDVERVMALAPGVTIATYNGHGPTGVGELWVIAERGRRTGGDLYRAEWGGNVVDVPALEWLAAQPNRPRIWICDAYVTGAGDQPAPNLTARCAAIARAAGIVRVPSFAALETLAARGRIA
jgi:hypothetical protein